MKTIKLPFLRRFILPHIAENQEFPHLILGLKTIPTAQTSIDWNDLGKGPFNSLCSLIVIPHMTIWPLQGPMTVHPVCSGELYEPFP